MFGRRPLFKTAILAGLGAALLVAGGASSSRHAATPKPVIGKPTMTPAQAAAGKRVAVSFNVTRSDTGTPLKTGVMTSEVMVGGKKTAHTRSFKGGIARLVLVVPVKAHGKTIRTKVTITSAGKTATRTGTFAVRGMPALSIADAGASEGNAGSTSLTFPVTLSAASAQTVTVAYTTSDGTGGSPGDYAAAKGSLTFQPGEKTKSITVSVVSDVAIEPDETFTVSISSPVNATIAAASATGTISNDDTAVPVTAGRYQGATQEGNYVFLTVTANRTLTGFRVNDMPESCDGPIELTGGIDWTENTFGITDDGTFIAEGSWTGSDKQGDAEWTSWSARLTGTFDGSSVKGTITVSNELNYKGIHYKCTTGEKTWSATRQG